MSTLRPSILLVMCTIRLSAIAQFNSADNLICPQCPFPLAVDLDHDGDTDLVFTDNFYITWMVGHGDGTFEPQQLLVENVHHLSIDLAGDADGDGDVDLVGASRADQGFDSTVAIIRHTDTGFEEVDIDHLPGCTHPPDHFADLDNDGDLDLLTLQGPGINLWYRNMGGGIYSRVPISDWCMNADFGPCVPIDIDNDGDKDLVAFSESFGKLIAHWNLGHGIFGPFTTISPYLFSASLPQTIDVADIDGDGSEDLVVGGRSVISQGTGSFTPPATYYWQDVLQSIGYVDCGPALDVILSSFQFTGIYSSAVNAGQSPTTYIITNNIFPIQRGTLAELNGDGLADLIIGPLYGSDLVRYRLNNAVPPDVIFDLPAEVDTLFTDTAFLLTGGYPTAGGGFYAGPGVFNDTLYSALASEGWNLITYHHASFLDFTYCQGSAVDSVFIIHTTGISELARDPIVTYPNPAADLVHLRWNDGPIERIIVRDMMGRSMDAHINMFARMDHEALLNVRDLSTGCYVITILRNGRRPRSVPITIAR